jgi:membrane-associated phospholipid phosphatase
MFLLPLEPPALLIPLRDPFVQYLGTGTLLTKDLFFSGHTSTLFLLFLTARGARLKAIFVVCTVGVAISVLLQHVHYSVDVFVAPFFAYAAYRVALAIDRKSLAFGTRAD